MNDWVADWDDVLRRAGRPRTRAWRVPMAAGVTALAVVLLMPGIGLGGRLKDMIAGSSPPAIHTRAKLVLPDGRSAGSLTAWTRPGQFRWTLALESRTARSARIELGYGPVVKLCSPCRDGEHGAILTGRRPVWFGPRTRVVLETRSGTAGGKIRIVR